MTDRVDIVTVNGLRRLGRVWAPAEADGGFGYTDGEAAEDYVRQVVEAAADRSSLSEELDGAIRDWPSEYHLSSRRANVLRPFDFSRAGRVLELGCGCGAVTRFLGEQGIGVDAVEGSRVRAEIAAARCADLDDVRVIHANFNELELPPRAYGAIFFIGVLEYALRFHAGAASAEEAVLAVLARARRALAPGGRIYVAIENRLGFKYLQGATEDHYGVPYIGLGGYPPGADIKTYSRREWRALFERDGWQGRCYLAFPDYKLCTALVYEGFAQREPSVAALLSTIRSRDYLRALPEGMDEALFWRGAVEAGALGDFANSFLWELNPPGEADTGAALDFAVCGGHLRKRCYRVMAWKPAGEDRVRRRRLDRRSPPAGGTLRQQVSDEPYLRGSLLSELWADHLRADGGLDGLVAQLRSYREFLEQLAHTGAPLYDALPGNIMVRPDGRQELFDAEWVLDQPVDVGFVLFRALLYFAAAHPRLVRPIFQEHGFGSLESFIIHCAEAAGCPMRGRTLGYGDLEQRIQGEILRGDAGSRVSALLKADLGRAEAGAFYHPRLYWAAAPKLLNEADSQRLSAGGGRGVQELSFRIEGPSQLGVLRFDPAEEDGFFKIHRLVAVHRAGAVARPLLDLGTAELRGLAWHGVLSGGGPAGEAFYADGHDPHVLLPLPSLLALGSGETVEVSVEMEWLGPREHLLIRSLYARRNRLLEGRVEALVQEREALRAAQAELELIKRSRVWRLAEALRRLLYQRLLGRTPRLRAGLLAASRRGFKATLRRWLARLRGRPVADDLPPPAPVTPEEAYRLWRRRQPVLLPEDARRRIAALHRRPKISIVMPVFNTEVRWLARAVDSVLAQTYDNWELCIADDASDRPETIRYLKHINDPKIRIAFRDRRGGISRATNDALAMISGDYVAFMDHDDELAPEALLEIASHLDQHDDDIVYTDEDFIDLDGERVNPHFKPDWSPDLLLSHNYITHLLVVRRSLVERLEGLRPEYDGAQDYDFLLRATEQTQRIGHVPKILYHWRKTAESTSLDAAAKPLAHRHGEAALRAALERRGIRGEVVRANKTNFYRVRRSLDQRNGPLVSIVIPFKDEPELLETCLDSILQRTSYRNYEILGVSNNSVQHETFALMERYGADPRIRFLEHNRPFNFSALVNTGVAGARGEHIVLLNNDIEIISWEWLSAMLEHSQRREIGVVGGKLYYPNHTVQHAGILLGLGGYAGHSHKHFRADQSGYFNRLNLIQNVSAVTGACMMFARTVFEHLGGFDEEAFAVAYNDVDFCLRALEAGYLNVFTPYAEAYHHESVSRGYEDTPERERRFSEEKARLLARHGARIAAGDPYYNPNLTLASEDFRLRLD